MVSTYEELSNERKSLQSSGHLPEWYTTAGWQMFKAKYAYEDINLGVKARFETIAKTLAQYLPEDIEIWEERFYDLMWSGVVSPSSPMLANTGTDRGCSVSCSGNTVKDSIEGFYSSRKEVALLTKQGFGTSSYLGDIRPRGAEIATGGKASGTLPVLKGFVQDMKDVSQGNVRRGAWAGYLPIDHVDFWEWVNYLHKNPDDLNVGWNISDEFIERLQSGDDDALSRYKRALKVKSETGKGYFFFPDKVKRMQPPMYEEHGLECKASQLCTEITLHSDDEHTYTCVLLSLNLALWDYIKENPMVIFYATVMADCLVEDFIQKGTGIKGLEKAVRFTEKSRALGIGDLGFHSYLQSKGVAIEQFDAHMINIDIFSTIQEYCTKASKWMAETYGEPEWCKGYGVRNTHLTAVAPNMSTAILMGGVSQGIEPYVANVFNQGSAAGEIERINPTFLKLMKERGEYNETTIQSVIDNKGSVQHLGWLTDQEKLVLKTAFEIDPYALIRLAATRQKYICQSQSLNLFFAADAEEEYVSQVHKEAFLNPNIKSLYYMRTLAGVQASKGECLACEG